MPAKIATMKGTSLKSFPTERSEPECLKSANAVASILLAQKLTETQQMS